MATTIQVNEEYPSAKNEVFSVSSSDSFVGVENRLVYSPPDQMGWIPSLDTMLALIQDQRSLKERELQNLKPVDTHPFLFACCC